MPELVGVELSVARTRLPADLDIETVPVAGTEDEDGVIKAQEPAPGESIGGTVKLTVARSLVPIQLDSLEPVEGEWYSTPGTGVAMMSGDLYLHSLSSSANVCSSSSEDGFVEYNLARAYTKFRTDVELADGSENDKLEVLLEVIADDRPVGKAKVKYGKPMPLDIDMTEVLRLRIQWRPVPFGRDARDRRIDLPLVWTSLLVGAIPRQGKTFAARLAAAGLVLDPYTRLYVADFKAGKDWDAAGQVAHRFMSGDESAHVVELVGWLVELVAEVQGRYRRMRELDDVVCPESKVTPEMSRDRSLDMPITAIFIDEVQVPLEDRTPVDVEGKRLAAGEYVGELLTWLAKKGPAAGIVLVLATQRPDSKTIPSGLRAVLGSRFALRVMDWRDSNIVLGEQMNTRGYDSSRLLASHKGVGILRPDGDTQAGADVLALTVRTYYMPNEDWQVICQRGRALREADGTLTGHAAGEAPVSVLDHSAAVLAIGSGTRRPSRSDDVPEPLASIVDHLDELGDVPEFVSTAGLAEALEFDPAWLGRRLAELGCQSTRERVTSESGKVRQIRGYLTADLFAAASANQGGDL